MEFQEIVKSTIDYIISQAPTWGPSAASIVGIIIAVVSYGRKVKKGVKEVHDAAVDIQEQKTIKELTTEIKGLRRDNSDLKKQISRLIDQLAKVKNYEKTKESSKKD